MNRYQPPKRHLPANEPEERKEYNREHAKDDCRHGFDPAAGPVSVRVTVGPDGGKSGPEAGGCCEREDYCQGVVYVVEARQAWSTAIAESRSHRNRSFCRIGCDQA